VAAYRFPPELCCESSANPYLALAAGALAGVEGVLDRLEAAAEPPAPPQSLEEALAKLDAQRLFLTRGGAFNDHLLDAWLENRWNQQVLPARKNRVVKRNA
jgi:glutamine synthetase